MNEFTRKAISLADEWVVASMYSVMAIQSGKTTDADPGAARAALLAHFEGGDQKWLPIETAPKDGKSILVFEPRSRGGVFIAHWLDWTLDPMRTGWQTNGHIVRPTHWMHLPATPTEESP